MNKGKKDIQQNNLPEEDRTSMPTDRGVSGCTVVVVLSKSGDLENENLEPNKPEF